MSTATNLPYPVSPEIQADFEAVIEHLQTGKPLDPQISNRIRERARKIRQEILDTHGVQNIGVEIIRELRGPLPQP